MNPKSDQPDSPDFYDTRRHLLAFLACRRKYARNLRFRRPAWLPCSEPGSKPSKVRHRKFILYKGLRQVGARRLELQTSSLSGTRSNQLSYAPKTLLISCLSPYKLLPYNKSQNAIKSNYAAYLFCAYWLYCALLMLLCPLILFK
jgi:hypothetical protein